MCVSTGCDRNSFKIHYYYKSVVHFYTPSFSLFSMKYVCFIWSNPGISRMAGSIGILCYCDSGLWISILSLFCVSFIKSMSIQLYLYILMITSSRVVHTCLMVTN